MKKAIKKILDAIMMLWAPMFFERPMEDTEVRNLDEYEIRAWHK